MTAPPVDAARQAALLDQGARVFTGDIGPEGGLDLAVVLDCLGELGVESLMVEGGGRVIASFLAQSLVDLVVLTIAPVFIGGVKAVNELLLVEETADLHISQFPHIKNMEVLKLGKDLIVWGWLDKT